MLGGGGLPCRFPQRAVPASQRVSAYASEFTWLSNQAWIKVSPCQPLLHPLLDCRNKGPALSRLSLGNSHQQVPRPRLDGAMVCLRRSPMKDGWTQSSTLIPGQRLLPTCCPQGWDGERGSHSSLLGCGSGALSPPSSLILALGHEQMSGAGACI